MLFAWFYRTRSCQSVVRVTRIFHTFPKMSSAATSTLLYAAAISTPQLQVSQPEDAADKKHHLQGGKGFTNPWDSYRDLSVAQVLGGLIW
jgi:hypothetical protein